MFDRPHHQRIERVLRSLDARLLRERQCLFAGGTVIALRYGEYRESVDIDFLVSVKEHYRALRNAMTGVDGVRAIMRADAPTPDQIGELRADQYGIRTNLDVLGAPIKLEIVFEARITLEPPSPDDAVCGIATLTPLDMATSKLLANSDRWRDDSVFSRDLIDLAMMRPKLPLLRAAVLKASSAYGDAVLRDLGRAIDRMQSQAGWLERCMQAMAMTEAPAAIWQRIRALRRVLRAPRVTTPG